MGSSRSRTLEGIPEAGEYLLANVGFSQEEQPFISLLKDGQLTSFLPLGHTLTLQFDTTQRFCRGWYDMTTSQDFACPDQQVVDKKYEQCPACQNRTGFNPAFYHATTVSKQQEARNLQPHFLYLAHFGEGATKVGISYEARERSRLFEQGARTALILDTFPTAHIARQYEAEIATLPGIAETVQQRKKIELLAQPYDAATGTKELIEVRDQIEGSLGKRFTRNEVMSFNHVYFPPGTPDLSGHFNCTPHDLISGSVIGMLGSLIFCDQQDTPTFLPLKKYVGYKLSLSYIQTPLKLPARQISLF